MGDFLIFRRNDQFSFTVCISPFPFDLYDHFVFIIGAIEVIGRRQVDLPFGIHIAEFVVFIEEITGADGGEVHAIGAHHLHDAQERAPSEPALLFSNSADPWRNGISLVAFTVARISPFGLI